MPCEINPLNTKLKTMCKVICPMFVTNDLVKINMQGLQGKLVILQNMQMLQRQNKYVWTFYMGGLQCAYILKRCFLQFIF